MKKRVLRISLLKTKKEELQLIGIKSKDVWVVENQKGKSIECFIADPNLERINNYCEKNDIKRSNIIIADITSRKNSHVGKVVISKIYQIKPPLQIDIEDYIKSSEATHFIN